MFANATLDTNYGERGNVSLKTKINGHRCYYVLPKVRFYVSKMDADFEKKRR